MSRKSFKLTVAPESEVNEKSGALSPRFSTSCSFRIRWCGVSQMTGQRGGVGSHDEFAFQFVVGFGFPRGSAPVREKRLRGPCPPGVVSLKWIDNRSNGSHGKCFSRRGLFPRGRSCASSRVHVRFPFTGPLRIKESINSRSRSLTQASWSEATGGEFRTRSIPSRTTRLRFWRASWTAPEVVGPDRRQCKSVFVWFCSCRKSLFLHQPFSSAVWH